MARIFLLTAGVAAWGAALYGSTQLHQLDLPIGHGICGPWGCAAQPEALLGYHLFWLVLLAPLTTLVVRASPSALAVRFAWGVAAAGLLGMVLLAAWAGAAWISDGEGAQYALQRGLFVIATTPDLPVMPLLLSGLAARLFGCCRRQTTHDSEQPAEAEGAEVSMAS
jgi:hypothetical protein